MLSAGCTNLSQEDQVTVLSFNIRYDNPGDGVDAWPNRSEWVRSVIEESGASVIGLQEALKHQILDIVSETNRFAFVGVGRNDGLEAGEFSPILYDSTLWRVRSWETRWLSTDSSVVGSVGWDAALPRIATIVDFNNVFTGKPLRVINTHFDHRGEEARIQSALLVSNWTKENDGAAILMGDFNFEQTGAAYQNAVGISQQASAQLTDSAALLNFASEPTFLGFDASNVVGPRIDYIFCNSEMVPMSYERLVHEREGRYLSDHTPIRVKLSF